MVGGKPLGGNMLRYRLLVFVVSLLNNSSIMVNCLIYER